MTSSYGRRLEFGIGVVPVSAGADLARAPARRADELRIDLVGIQADSGGLWSEKVGRPSIEEHVQWRDRLERVLGGALAHVDLTLRESTTAGDLAYTSTIEGVWLNQCPTTRHPSDPSEPIATVLCRSGRLIRLGAARPRTLAR